MKLDGIAMSRPLFPYREELHHWTHLSTLFGSPQCQFAPTTPRPKLSRSSSADGNLAVETILAGRKVDQHVNGVLSMTYSPQCRQQASARRFDALGFIVARRIFRYIVAWRTSQDSARDPSTCGLTCERMDLPEAPGTARQAAR